MPRRRRSRSTSSGSGSSRSASPEQQSRRRRSPTPPSRSKSHSKRTSKKRKRRRERSSDSSDEDEDQPRNKIVGQTLVADAGYVFGRHVHMWTSPLSIFRFGMTHNPARPLSELSPSEKQLLRCFDIFTTVFPDVYDILEKQTDGQVAAMWMNQASKIITKNTRNARSTDVRTLKTAFIEKGKNWTTPYPSDKALAGFGNEVCGKALCPTNLEWNDKTKHDLQTTLKAKAGPEQLCRLMYRDNDPSDLNGLFKHSLVVFGAKAIYLGPKAAFESSEPTSHRPGNAAKHGIAKMSLPSIAYCTCLVHFVLSSQLKMGSGSRCGGWRYDTFYKTLLNTMDSMHSMKRKELLHWWDTQLFGESDDEPSGDTGPSPAQDLAAALRKQGEEIDRQQAAAAAAATAAATTATTSNTNP
ncbi:hypothetical protein EV715DRAFT_293624 [Schizophyllum commune]